LSRYFLKIAYNGVAYHGWQLQPGLDTVQLKIEMALSLLLKHNCHVVGCGRTDAGVHAKMYYLHFDTDVEIQDKLVLKMNGVLPDDIVVYKIYKVNENAHARYDAIFRQYQYKIHLYKNPFLKQISTLKRFEYDLVMMNKASEILKETKNFASFCKSGTDVTTFLCNVTEAYWDRNEDQIIFTIGANRFLRNMVRSIVGTMLQLGNGRITLEEFIKIIDARDRSMAGKSIESWGLFLTNVVYPDKIFINE
jgi:tRNA pseudouridine38-40 synthase